MADEPTPDTLARVRRRLAAGTRARNLRDGVFASRVQPVPAEARALRADARLLVGSPLFDHVWYAACVGRALGRSAAARDYLTRGAELGATPHPLFDPDTFRQARPDDVGDTDPLVAYLRGRDHRAPTHPLFDTEAYLERHPQSEHHDGGPVAHYVERGEQAEAPNDWFAPTPEHPTFSGWLADQRDRWVARRQAALSAWGGDYDKAAARAHEAAASGSPASTAALVTVVVTARQDGELVRRTVESALAQTGVAVEVLVTSVGERALGAVNADERVSVVPGTAATPDQARNRALALAQGSLIAWLEEGEVLLPGRLTRLADALATSGSSLVHDVLEDTSVSWGNRYAARAATAARLAEGFRVELSSVLASVAACRAAGGFDEELAGAADHDLVLRLAAGGAIPFVPVLGARVDRAQRRELATVRPREQPWLDAPRLDSWHDVVLNRHEVDWDELAGRPVEAGLISVIMPTYKDWEMTTQAVARVADDARETGERIEIIVVDNGCDLAASTALASLPLRHAATTVVANAVNHGFALGNNLGLRSAHGDVVVFLNNDTEAQPGWLAPLRAALADDGVLAAQSLLVFPSGAVQSAGIAFPVGGGVPHELLGGFPVEDAEGLEGESFHALTAASLAVRHADVVALRGFDPIFRNGMEDVDFCLRLGRLRPGRMVVRPDSRVVHHESRSTGRFARSVVNRRVFLDRWADRLPADDVALWAGRGFEVVGHEARRAGFDDRRLWQPTPVIAGRLRPALRIDEPAPVLRWAIKNPAPAGEIGERWGDTHFADQLAAALRALGQEVVIDRRPEFHRESGRLDDVVLVLRGLAPYKPAWGQVSLMWLISHPEMFARHEAAVFDRVLAASISWSAKISRTWGIRVDPLLQATDPAVFHPDLAAPDSGHELLFVGSSRRQLRTMVRDALAKNLPLSVYGDHWEGLIPDSFVRATYLPNSAVGAAYRSAGIVLNDHWDDMRDEGFLSNRLFDAVAAGARVITDDVAGLDEVFGPTVQVARSATELAALVNAPDRDAIFGSDDVRREWAGRIHREHSFLARAQTLLDVALDVRKNGAGRPGA